MFWKWIELFFELQTEGEKLRFNSIINISIYIYNLQSDIKRLEIEYGERSMDSNITMAMSTQVVQWQMLLNFQSRIKQTKSYGNHFNFEDTLLQSYRERYGIFRTVWFQAIWYNSFLLSSQEGDGEWLIRIQIEYLFSS